MQQNQDNPQSNKKRQIIFATVSILAVVIVGIIAYFALSKIKNNQASDIMSQEQFEGAPTISSQLQSECQQSAIKISEFEDGSKMETEFRANVENCRDVYYLIEHETQFPKEGMYPDLAVAIALYMAKTDKPKALELLKFAGDMKPWEFYLGPVTCDSKHVIDAYTESVNLPEDKVCFTRADYKETLLKELGNRNYSILTKMLANDQVVWMGLPDSDVGCPEKVSSVMNTVKKYSQGANFEEAPTDPNDTNKLYLVAKTTGEDKLTLIFNTVNNCLQINSLLVPNLEVSE